MLSHAEQRLDFCGQRGDNDDSGQRRPGHVNRVAAAVRRAVGHRRRRRRQVLLQEHQEEGQKEGKLRKEQASHFTYTMHPRAIHSVNGIAI